MDIHRLLYKFTIILIRALFRWKNPTVPPQDNVSMRKPENYKTDIIMNISCQLITEMSPIPGIDPGLFQLFSPESYTTY